MPMRQILLVRLLAASISLLACAGSWAATIYGTLFTSPGQIVRIDTVTQQVTPLLTTGPFPDSIIFDAAGRIIYSVYGANQVRRFDPATASDSLVSGGFSGPLDLALDPGGQSVLVSNNTTPRIDRLNLVTGVVTPFLATGGAGVTYDASGRLYAVLPGRLAELNPTTGAVLQFTPGVLVLDGVAFDPSTGNLYATDGSGGHLYRFDRNNLAAGGQLHATLIGAGGFADGLAADGLGNLFVAVRNVANEAQSGLIRVNAVTGAFSQVAFAPFLDDIAPITGLGAPPPVVSGRAIDVPTLSETLLIALSIMLAGMALRQFGNARKT